MHQNMAIIYTIPVQEVRKRWRRNTCMFSEQTYTTACLIRKFLKKAIWLYKEIDPNYIFIMVPHLFLKEKTDWKKKRLL